MGDDETVLTRVAGRLLSSDEILSLEQEYDARDDRATSFSDYLAALIDGRMTSLYQEAVRKLQVVGEAPSQPQRIIPRYFDFSRLTPMQEGRARKSLDVTFRYHGERMTRGVIYARFAPVAKRLGKKQVKRHYTNIFGATMHDWVEAPEYYLVNAQSAVLDVPKILYDICTLPVIDRKQAA